MTELSTLALTQPDHDTIAAVMAAIMSRWPVERIILFGSKARGDHEPDSDIDLLVITTPELDREAEDAMQDAAWETGLEHERCVQLVIRSHERWYHGIHQATPLRPASRSACRPPITATRTAASSAPETSAIPRKARSRSNVAITLPRSK